MAVRQAESDEEFARRVGDIPNQGFVAIGLALGEELGLWDVMAKFDRPASHREIAEAAGMKPRSVGYTIWAKTCQLSNQTVYIFLSRHLCKHRFNIHIVVLICVSQVKIHITKESNGFYSFLNYTEYSINLETLL